ncbi:MAG: hypothetical protein ABSB74_15015 [Tepidisphaeraceae bacterium]|jgi:hypothetical protein
MHKRKRYSEMTTAQLREATRQYDRQWTGPGLPGRPLTAADRALHRKARGRPMVGKGAKIVPVSIERELLTRADAFAHRHKLKRSEMVAQGLRLVMAKQA